MSKEFRDFYKWSSDKLNELGNLDHTSKEAEKIKIEMGYSANADYWDINHDVVKIRDVANWYEEWKQRRLMMYKPITVEYTSDDLLWIDFKGKEIRIEQDEQFNNGQLQITVHKPGEDYHAKLIVNEEELNNDTV